MTVTLPLYLYLDLESLPSQDPAVMREIIAKHATEPLDESTIKPAANLTDPVKIAADLEKRLEKARAEQMEKVDKAAKATDEEYRKTCLDATTGHIACISAALGEGAVHTSFNYACAHFGFDPAAGIAAGPVKAPSFADVMSGEREMLRDFFRNVEAQVTTWAEYEALQAWEAANPQQNDDGRWHLNATADGAYGCFVADRGLWLAERAARYRRVPTIVCHHAGFDVRYIWQRCIILGVPVPTWWPIDAKPWDTDRVDDTMTAWAGHGGRIGLDRLCRALGIPGKPDDIDGSRVWDAVREGRIFDVADYCDGDVERLRAVHRRIRGLEEPKQQFMNLQLGVAWTQAESDELFAAADAAADRIHGRVGEPL